MSSSINNTSVSQKFSDFILRPQENTNYPTTRYIASLAVKIGLLYVPVVIANKLDDKTRKITVINPNLENLRESIRSKKQDYQDLVEFISNAEDNFKSTIDQKVENYEKFILPDLTSDPQEQSEALVHYRSTLEEGFEEEIKSPKERLLSLQKEIGSEVAKLGKYASSEQISKPAIVKDPSLSKAAILEATERHELLKSSETPSAAIKKPDEKTSARPTITVTENTNRAARLKAITQEIQDLKRRPLTEIINASLNKLYAERHQLLAQPSGDTEKADSNLEDKKSTILDKLRNIKADIRELEMSDGPGIKASLSALFKKRADLEAEYKSLTPPMLDNALKTHDVSASMRSSQANIRFPDIQESNDRVFNVAQLNKAITQSEDVLEALKKENTHREQQLKQVVEKLIQSDDDFDKFSDLRFEKNLIEQQMRSNLSEQDVVRKKIEAYRKEIIRIENLN